MLARGDDYVDALAGVPFAAHLHGPLLLTEPKTLDASIEAEIHRVLGDPAWGGTIHILGGDKAISPAVEAKLAADGYHVVRDAGANRYETSLLIAEQFNPSAEVVVATTDDYADALSAGPLAAARKAPLLLSSKGRLTEATASFLADHAVIDAVGKPAAEAVTHAGLAATPLWGEDRYATSRLVAQAVADTPGIGEKSIGLASGTSFADAVTGGAFAANAHMPLLLVEPGQPTTDTTDFLHGWLPQLTSVDLFGGTSVLAQGIADQVLGRLGAHTAGALAGAG